MFPELNSIHIEFKYTFLDFSFFWHFRTLSIEVFFFLFELKFLFKCLTAYHTRWLSVAFSLLISVVGCYLPLHDFYSEIKGSFFSVVTSASFHESQSLAVREGERLWSDEKSNEVWWLPTHLQFPSPSCFLPLPKFSSQLSHAPLRIAKSLLSSDSSPFYAAIALRLTNSGLEEVEKSTNLLFLFRLSHAR